MNSANPPALSFLMCLVLTMVHVASNGLKVAVFGSEHPVTYPSELLIDACAFFVTLGILFILARLLSWMISRGRR